MSEPQTKPESKPAVEVAAPAKKSKLIPMLLGLNSLMLIGVVAVLALKGLPGHGGPRKTAEGAEESTAEGASEAPAEEHAEGATGKLPSPGKPGPSLRLPDFVVRLRNTDTDRYARFSFEVELASELDKEAFTAFTPQVRDTFISFLSDRTLEELQGSHNLDETKRGLLERVTALSPGVRIRSIYITDFVVQ